ncbi:1285_t:CDS:2 [Rhizophagus irregularis]|nr:1285_t:CDS:2 [Rhizophagus irregularis]
MSTTTTEKYIGYDALVSYLIKSRNCQSYHGFLDLNRTIIISSLNSQTSTSLALNEWKNVDIIWYTHYLDEAKRLLEPDDFDTVKKKKCEKENLVPAVTSIASSVEVSSQPDALLPKKTVNLSEISQLDLSKKNIKLIDFCYDILHELENEFYAHKFNKYIDKDIENKVIKHPISLFTINLKLKNNQYTSLEEFEKDILLKQFIDRIYTRDFHSGNGYQISMIILITYNSQPVNNMSSNDVIIYVLNYNYNIRMI